MVNEFVLHGYQETIGSFLRSGESASRRFAVLLWNRDVVHDKPSEPDWQTGIEAWVYLTQERLLFVSRVPRQPGHLIVEFNLRDLVGARVHKQEVDLFFVESGVIIGGRMWVRPRKYGSLLIELAVTGRNRLADSLLRDDAIAHLPRDRREWANLASVWIPPIT